jgi:hypothetical protein
VELPDGYVAITFKRLGLDWRDGAGQDDHGDIARYLFDPAGSWIDTEVMIDSEGSGWTSCGNRPHTQLLRYSGRTYLVTTWDEWNGRDGSTGERLDIGAAPLGCVVRVELWVP